MGVPTTETGDFPGENHSYVIFAVFLGILLWPGAFTAFAVRSLLTKGRLRLSVITIVSMASELFLLVLWNITSAHDAISQALSHVKHTGSAVGMLAPAYFIFAIALGVVAGWVFVMIEIRSLSASPHRLEIKNAWCYHFQYRRTPWQTFRRKKNIEKLEMGVTTSSEEVPLGLTEDGLDNIVGRYYSEAKTHTLITGSSGSGKGLHKDVLLPTSKGLLKVKDIDRGEILYDERGEETRVLARYQPMTKDHYRITFSDRSKVDTCGDHLWQVSRTDKRGNGWTPLRTKVMNTRDIYYEGIIDPLNKTKFLVPSMTKEVNYREQVLPIPPYDLGILMASTNSEEGTSPISDSEYSSKGISTQYLIGSKQQRLELLMGILDTAGLCADDGTVTLSMTNQVLVMGARQVVCSLGWIPTNIRVKASTNSLADGGLTSGTEKIYSFSFRPYEQVFRVGRGAEVIEKILSLDGDTEHQSRYIVDITSIHDRPEDYYCFTVDSPSHLFLCSESFIPTHNTITMQTLIHGDIINHVPTIIIDMKRSPEFASKVATWTKQYGGEFYHFVNGNEKDYDIIDSPRRQCYYDPLAGGTATSIADMLLGMREYDQASAVYRANMQQLLQVLMTALFSGKNEGWGYDPYVEQEETGNNSVVKHLEDLKTSIDYDNTWLLTIASALTKGSESQIARVAKGDPAFPEINDVVEQLTDRQRNGITHAAEELRGQLRTIIASEYGRWLRSPARGDENRAINLYELSKTPGNVIMFSLNSDSEPDFASLMGALILSDITNVSAKRRNSQADNFVSIYIDEFQAVNPESVTSLLEKARESRMGLTLAQQSFEQIVSSSKQNGESYLLSVLDTCSNFITHSGSTQDSAERLSKILGKHWETVYRVSNRNKSFFMSFNWANRRESIVQTAQEEKWVYEPREFMNLSSPTRLNNFKSTAILINKSCDDPNYNTTEGAVARKVWVLTPKEILATYYKPEQAKSDYASLLITDPSSKSALIESQTTMVDELDDLPHDSPMALPLPDVPPIKVTRASKLPPVFAPTLTAPMDPEPTMPDDDDGPMFEPKEEGSEESAEVLPAEVHDNHFFEQVEDNKPKEKSFDRNKIKLPSI
jgi:hypothetical protein